MKRLLTVAALLVAATVVCLTAGTPNAAPTPAPQVRIGVFDSRAVALAYWRSSEGMTELRALHDEYAKAKAANDAPRIKELEQEGPWRQVRMHQQVFSTATAATIVAKISDRLPAVAKDAGVAAIVSKWEVPYKDTAVETVDVTLPMCRLFKPDEQLLKMIEQMMGQPPVPFEKLGLDPNM